MTLRKNLKADYMHLRALKTSLKIVLRKKKIQLQQSRSSAFDVAKKKSWSWTRDMIKSQLKKKSWSSALATSSGHTWKCESWSFTCYIIRSHLKVKILIFQLTSSSHTWKCESWSFFSQLKTWNKKQRRSKCRSKKLLNS